MLEVIRHHAGPPKFWCRVCRTPFFEGEHTAYERHVIACADRHEDQMRAHSPRARAPGLFDPVHFDSEFEAWVKANRDAILEDRKKM